MFSNNKLQDITKMLTANKSPNQSRVQDDSMSLDQSMNMNPFQTNSPMGRKDSPGKNLDNSDIMDTSGFKAMNTSAMREMINNYGMS